MMEIILKAIVLVFVLTVIVPLAIGSFAEKGKKYE